MGQHASNAEDGTDEKFDVGYYTYTSEPKKETMKHKPVIIIPCSAKKSKWNRQIERAFDYYDGPLWQTLRVLLAGDGSVQNIQTWWVLEEPFDLYALSAEYGLIPITKKIKPYDTLLGRDVSKKNLVSKVKRQLSSLDLEGRDIYAFTSKSYSNVLAEAGLSFCYVKGGIGMKRKRLKELWVKQKLPKSQVELYKGEKK